MPRALPTDETLARRAQQGDAEAYDQLVRRYLRPTLALAWEFTGVREEAEDLAQETFHRVVRALDRYDPGRPFRPWLFTILRNLGRNAAKWANRWNAEPVSDELVDGADPLSEVERQEIWNRLETGMASLPEMQLACFRLTDLEGFTGAEVGDMLGIAEGTVRAHVHRARRSLRRVLQSVKDGKSGR